MVQLFNKFLRFSFEITMSMHESQLFLIIFGVKARLPSTVEFKASNLAAHLLIWWIKGYIVKATRKAPLNPHFITNLLLNIFRW